MSMTTGEDAQADELRVHEPFVKTSAADELAAGTEAPNIPKATREPVPHANASSAEKGPEKILKYVPPLHEVLARGETLLRGKAAQIADRAGALLDEWKAKRSAKSD